MLKIKNQTEQSAEIYLSGYIVDDEIGHCIAEYSKNGNIDGYEWPKEVKRQLDSIRDKDLLIYINSYGGSVSAGVAMANMIARHGGHTTAIIDGFCCSIATQIFFSAETCKMPSNAYLMIHRPEVEIVGNAIALRECADFLDTIQRGLETTYRNKKIGGVTDEEISTMMNEEIWMTGEEAIQYFDIELMEPVKMVNCAGSLEKLKSLNYKKIPENLTFNLGKNNNNLANKISDKMALNNNSEYLLSKNEITTSQKIKIAIARARGALI